MTAHATLIEFLGGLLGALIGAAAAIGGVILQRRFEHNDRKAEELRQRKAIAKALVFEIEGVRDYYLIPLRDALVDFQAGAEHVVPLKSPPTNPFPIFRANAHRIGEFSGAELNALIGFYNPAEDFTVTLADAVRAKQNLQIAGDVPRAQGAARQLYHQLQDMIPRLLPLAQTAADALESLQQSQE